MTTKIGNLGEQLVIQWLKSKAYRILHHSWHCRWGEIDIIAEDKNRNSLIFVEVKTRSKSNWDNYGLDAISEEKQAKISKSAALFLAKNIQYTDFYMRFDVALVEYQKMHKDSSSDVPIDRKVEANNNIQIKELNQFMNVINCDCVLKMVDYLENAFEFYS